MKMDGRDSAECQNWEKKDVMVIIVIVLNENNATIVHSTHLLKLKREERVFLLSRISGNPTFDSLRDEKESCSTQRGLRVGIRFKEFRQTP